jgi:hypothetical protein
MTLPFNAAVDDVLRQRELLLRALDSAREHSDDEQEARLEYLLGTLDDVLAVVACTEARH